MKKEKISLVIYSMVGIIVGYISFLINNNWLSLLLAIIVLFGMSEILKKALKIKEKFKWFLSNGGWIYIFIWFITWIIFYNL